MEYCNGGTLHKNLYDYKNKYGKPFSEEIVQIIMKKILTGVNYLHQKGIIHRDLKLGNILLNYENELNKNIFSADIKIIDFNTSFIAGSSEPMTFLGTVPNMAPSVAKNLFNPHSYNEKIDIWSLGIVCMKCFWKASFSKYEL